MKSRLAALTVTSLLTLGLMGARTLFVWVSDLFLTLSLPISKLFFLEIRPHPVVEGSLKGSEITVSESSVLVILYRSDKVVEKQRKGRVLVQFRL